LRVLLGILISLAIVRIIFDVGSQKTQSQRSQRSQGSTGNTITEYEYAGYVKQQAEKFDKIAPEPEPKLADYVHRRGDSDIFYCDYCRCSDDKWGMAKHTHTPDQMKKKRKFKT